MAESKQRTIEAHADDFLALKDVAKALTIDERTLKRLIADGQFPRPLKIGGTRLWTWKDLFIYFGWLELEPRMRAKKRKPGAIGDKPGQSGTTERKGK